MEANLTVLAQNSKYFEGNVSFSADGEVTFDSEIVSFRALKKIICFLESGGDLSPSMEDFEELLSAADYLQVDSALALLVEYLHTDLGVEIRKNFTSFSKKKLVLYLSSFAAVRRYEITHKYDPGNITLWNPGYPKNTRKDVPRSFGFVLSYHFDRIMNELEVLQLNLDGLTELLTSDYLIITEANVLRTIKMWVYFDFRGRRKFFSQLLECVRPGLTVWKIYCAMCFKLKMFLLKFIKANLIVDELTCRCYKGIKCSCLTSPEYVIAALAYVTSKNQDGHLNYATRDRLKFIN